MGAALREGAASLGATLLGGAASLGAALSLGRRGAIPSGPHDDGVVRLLGWGASVSCGSARVLASHARWVEVAVVMGVAVGAVAGAARSAGWGSRGSSCTTSVPKSHIQISPGCTSPLISRSEATYMGARSAKLD